MKVILAVDDSPHSQAAVGWVKQMSWPERTRFVVVSSVPLLIEAYAMVEAGGTGALDLAQEESAKARRAVVAHLKRELQASGLDVDTRVELGDARDFIVRTAELERADLVVVGSHGRTGIPRLLMGSVASYVVTHAPCSVVVVKSPTAVTAKRA